MGGCKIQNAMEIESFINDFRSTAYSIQTQIQSLDICLGGFQVLEHYIHFPPVLTCEEDFPSPHCSSAFSLKINWELGIVIERMCGAILYFIGFPFLYQRTYHHPGSTTWVASLPSLFCLGELQDIVFIIHSNFHQRGVVSFLGVTLTCYRLECYGCNKNSYKL